MTADDVRARFEAWLLDRGIEAPRRANGHYQSDETCFWWKLWQDACRAALLASPAPSPARGDGGEGRSHRWDKDGERCVVCGDKDWMGGPCNGPRTATTQDIRP